MVSHPTYCPGMVFLLFFFGQVAEELAVGTYCIDFEGVTQSPGGQVEGWVQLSPVLGQRSSCFMVFTSDS